jgi:hypothetical protein
MTVAERFVYFVRPVGQDGPIKIGVANVPTKRLAQIMAWSPVDLEILVTVPGNGALERNLHECFAYAHVRGEWFSPVSDLLKGIASLKQGAAVEEAFDLSNRTGSLWKKHPSIMARFTPAYCERQSYRKRILNARRRLGHAGIPEPFTTTQADVVLGSSSTQTPLTEAEKQVLDDYLRQLSFAAFQGGLAPKPSRSKYQRP